MGGSFALVPSHPTPHPPSNYATNPRVRDWGSPRRAVTAVRLRARSQARHRGDRPPVPSRRCGALRRGRSSGVSHPESVADAWTSLGFIADEALVAPEHLFDGVVPLVLCVDVGIHAGDLTLVRSMRARVPGRGRWPNFPRIGFDGAHGGVILRRPSEHSSEHFLRRHGYPSGGMIGEKPVFTGDSDPTVTARNPARLLCKQEVAGSIPAGSTD